MVVATVCGGVFGNGWLAADRCHVSPRPASGQPIAHLWHRRVLMLAARGKTGRGG